MQSHWSPYDSILKLAFCTGHLPQVDDGPQGRQQGLGSVAPHASLAQEHCQACDDAVQHFLFGLQNTLRSVPP